MPCKRTGTIDWPSLTFMPSEAVTFSAIVAVPSQPKSKHHSEFTLYLLTNL